MTPSAHISPPAARDRKIFCFGFGYTAAFLAPVLREAGWKVAGTTTVPAKKEFLERRGIATHLFDRTHPVTDPYQVFHDVTHVLLSIPPGAEGDPVAEIHGMDIAAMPNLEWLGYLSTTAVYGNHDGAWVDEATPPNPDSRRGSLRLRAEQQWQSLYMNEGVPLHIFRLAGIYGPGRSAIDSAHAGTARRIDKPGHVFNRIHVTDIVKTLVASIDAPNPGGIYNLADDLPSPSHEVIALACDLIGAEPPPLVRFDQAELAPIVRSFYKDNKRVRNDRIKTELGVVLDYPDYRAGLMSCLEVDGDTAALLELTGTDAGA